MIEHKVQAAVDAVCPGANVSFGVRTDKATWKISFPPSATAEQRADAQAAIDAFDAGKIEHNSGIDAQIATLEVAAGGYNRGVREFMLGAVKMLKDLGAPDASGTPGMVKVKQLDDAIKALRAQRLP